MTIEPGLYKHYKGNYYLVIGEVVEHGSRNILVLYIPLYVKEGTQSMTVRPIWEFLDKFRRVNS